jgi:hypothetical protein
MLHDYDRHNKRKKRTHIASNATEKLLWKNHAMRSCIAISVPKHMLHDGDGTDATHITHGGHIHGNGNTYTLYGQLLSIIEYQPWNDDQLRSLYGGEYGHDIHMISSHPSICGHSSTGRPSTRNDIDGDDGDHDGMHMRMHKKRTRMPWPAAPIQMVLVHIAQRITSSHSNITNNLEARRMLARIPLPIIITRTRAHIQSSKKHQCDNDYLLRWFPLKWVQHRSLAFIPMTNHPLRHIIAPAHRRDIVSYVVEVSS